MHALMQAPDDTETTKQNILKLIYNKDIAEMLSINAYKIAQENTYQKRCKHIIEEWIN